MPSTWHAQIIIEMLSASHMYTVFKSMTQITMGLQSYWWDRKETRQFSNTNNFKLGQEGLLSVGLKSMREAFQLAG